MNSIATGRLRPYTMTWLVVQSHFSQHLHTVLKRFFLACSMDSMTRWPYTMSVSGAVLHEGRGHTQRHCRVFWLGRVRTGKWTNH